MHLPQARKNSKPLHMLQRKTATSIVRQSAAMRARHELRGAVLREGRMEDGGAATGVVLPPPLLPRHLSSRPRILPERCIVISTALAALVAASGP